MPPYEFVAFEASGGIATATLRRPEKLNAFHEGMLRELRHVLEEAAARHEIRILILTGAGRAFCAGADFGWFDVETLGREPTARFRAMAAATHAVLDGIEALEKPVIAAINGLCVGGGLEMALACDIRIAAEDARLSLPEVNAGIIPGSGGCSRLVRLLGAARAKELVFTGEPVSAAEARAMGLVNRTVPAADLMAESRRFAEGLLGKAPQALGIAKLLINSAAQAAGGADRMLERLGQSILLPTADAAEGARAFRARRPPTFTGR
ncbi:MAG TPA: enoyl-CoA hydratase/isomerase family protein [Candidatus Methylomirabilis sp.]|jgi:enoyl-CoA hydratase/carnithine racemase